MVDSIMSSKLRETKCCICEKQKDLKLTFKCLSCRLDICQNCIKKEKSFNSENFEPSKFICDGCNESSKSKKKVDQQKNPQKNETKIFERKVLGNKRKGVTLDKINEVPIMTPSSNTKNITEFLDIDGLHNLATPPSELCNSDQDESRGEFQNSKKTNTLRKSQREKKIKNYRLSEGENQLINCHQCKRIDNAFNLITCSNFNCRESFCHKCILKCYSNSTEDVRRIKADHKTNWECFICREICNCTNCSSSKTKNDLTSNGINTRNIEINKPNNSRINRSRIQRRHTRVKKEEKPKKHEKSDKKEISNSQLVKIDDFVILEGEESEGEPIEETKNDEKVIQQEIKEPQKIEDNSDKNLKKDEIKSVKVDNNQDKKEFQIFKNVEVYSNIPARTLSIECLVCRKKELLSEDILKFKSTREFLDYIKLKFELNDFIITDKDSISKNQEKFNDFFRNNSENLVAFRVAKHTCKGCFNKYFNLKDGFAMLCKAFKLLNQVKKINNDPIINNTKNNEETTPKNTLIKTKELVEINENEKPEVSNSNKIQENDQKNQNELSNKVELKIKTNSIVSSSSVVIENLNSNDNSKNINVDLSKSLEKPIISNSIQQNFNQNTNPNYLADNTNKLKCDSIKADLITIKSDDLGLVSADQQKANFLYNLIEDLKKQVYSIQFYSLMQKSFISFIFKNLENYINQIIYNQIMNELVTNNLAKNLPKIANNVTQDHLKSLNDHSNNLKKINILGQSITNSLHNSIEDMKGNGYKLLVKDQPKTQNMSSFENLLVQGNEFRSINSNENLIRNNLSENLKYDNDIINKMNFFNSMQKLSGINSLHVNQTNVNIYNGFQSQHPEIIPRLERPIMSQMNNQLNQYHQMQPNLDILMPQIHNQNNNLVFDTDLINKNFLLNNERKNLNNPHPRYFNNEKN